MDKLAKDGCGRLRRVLVAERGPDKVVLIYGERDPVAAAPRLEHFVPNADVVSLDCGHWIQEELPDQTNRTMLEWLGRHRVA